MLLLVSEKLIKMLEEIFIIQLFMLCLQSIIKTNDANINNYVKQFYELFEFVIKSC